MSAALSGSVFGMDCFHFISLLINHELFQSLSDVKQNSRYSVRDYLYSFKTGSFINFSLALGHRSLWKFISTYSWIEEMPSFCWDPSHNLNSSLPSNLAQYDNFPVPSFYIKTYIAWEKSNWIKELKKIQKECKRFSPPPLMYEYLLC